MKSSTINRILSLTAGVVLIGAVQAHADDCVALGGAVASGECRVASAVSKSGTFAIAETLRVLSTGSITVPAAAGGAALTLNVAGNFLVDTPPGNDGGRIVGDVKGSSAVGATIAIYASGDIVLDGKTSTGALISANQVSDTCTGGRAGSVSLQAGGNLQAEAGTLVAANGIGCAPGAISMSGQAVSIDGVVQSETTLEASVGGGHVDLNAGCSLALGKNAAVTSRGEQRGSNLITLSGPCGVDVKGEVDPMPRR